ncbi:MAG: SCO7613 C-terminal domain-containing membrane protein, partial [Actinomadura sp.]
AVPAALTALVTRPATLVVLGVLTLLSAGVAAVAPALRSGATAVAVLVLGGFAAALGLVAGLPAHGAAFGVLAVAALGLAAATWVRSVPAEVAGWVVAVAAVAMTAEHQAVFSLALGLTGVLALGVALRADRRPAAAWAGSALLLVAFWIRLAAAGVTVPEAYAAPPAAGALLVGALRRRRERTVSSWPAYGPGLACILLPSLLAVWAETGRLRAVLLAIAAAAVALIGARARLQAPLLFGGAVLLLDAVHELAPAVARVTVRLPGWFPIAVIGLAILLTGATYERRLRDLRRLREAVSRLG